MRHLLLLLDVPGERADRLHQRVAGAALADAAAHVDEEQRVVHGGDLGVQDRLLALVLGDELPVLVDAKLVGRQPADGVARSASPL